MMFNTESHPAFLAPPLRLIACQTQINVWKIYVEPIPGRIIMTLQLNIVPIPMSIFSITINPIGLISYFF